MNHNLFRIVAGLVIVTTSVVIIKEEFFTNTPGKIVKVSGRGFAVLELFTSEGCSSCPPADAEVEKISVLHPDDVYVLGFHVDYWNRFGWNDEFSSAAWSERQRGYGDHFNLNSVYTPQVVVNGKVQLVGSDAALLTKTVDTEIKNNYNRVMELSASVSAGNTVNVAYKLLQAPANATVNIALIQITAQTRVIRGENQGKTLHHINIVRDFKTVGNPGQAGSAPFPCQMGWWQKNVK